MLRKSICRVKKVLFCSNRKRSISEREKSGGGVKGFFHFVFVLGSAPAVLNMFCFAHSSQTHSDRSLTI